MSIGKNIYDLRKSKGVTQKELANALCVTLQAISKWENNVCAPSADLFPLLADFFGVSIDRLFGYTGNSSGSAESTEQNKSTNNADTLE